MQMTPDNHETPPRYKWVVYGNNPDMSRCDRGIFGPFSERERAEAFAKTLPHGGTVNWELIRRRHVACVIDPARDGAALIEALKPFARIPLCHPRRGSQPQQAELDVPAPGGAYTAADVVRARKLLP